MKQVSLQNSFHQQKKTNKNKKIFPKHKVNGVLADIDFKSVQTFLSWCNLMLAISIIQYKVRYKLQNVCKIGLCLTIKF